MFWKSFQEKQNEPWWAGEVGDQKPGAWHVGLRWTTGASGLTTQEKRPPNAAEIILHKAASPGQKLWESLERSSRLHKTPLALGGVCPLKPIRALRTGLGWVITHTGVVLKPCQFAPHKGCWDFEQMLIDAFKQHLLMAVRRLPNKWHETKEWDSEAGLKEMRADSSSLPINWEGRHSMSGRLE